MRCHRNFCLYLLTYGKTGYKFYNKNLLYILLLQFQELLTLFCEDLLYSNYLIYFKCLNKEKLL